MPIYDTNLVWRSNDTDLTESANGTSVKVGVDLAPQVHMVNVPAAPTGTNPTLDVKIQESDNNSTWRDVAVFPQITAAGTYLVTTKSNAVYRRASWTIGGTNTPNFGKVLIAPVPGGSGQNF